MCFGKFPWQIPHQRRTPHGSLPKSTSSNKHTVPTVFFYSYRTFQQQAELLSLVVKGMGQEQKHISVKLDYKDIRNLRKTVTVMKNDLAAYPTGEELAQIAGMSTARYQLAFRKYYGTTPYEYLKELRLNQALILLKNSDYGIATIAAKVGYHNSGHFAKLFKKAYGLGPREYRNLHGIK